MRVQIRRVRGEDGRPPLPGARRCHFVRVDRRTVGDPGVVPAYAGRRDWWYRAGRNHRVEGETICRDLPAEGWFVDVARLDDLWALASRYGEVTLRPSPLNPAVPEIELDELAGRDGGEESDEQGVLA